MKKKYLFMAGLLCLYLAGYSTIVSAQLLASSRPQERVGPGSQGQQSLEQVLKTLETKYSIFFMYQSDKIRKIQKKPLTSAILQARQRWFSVCIFPLALFFGLTRNSQQSALAQSLHPL